MPEGTVATGAGYCQACGDWTEGHWFIHGRVVWFDCHTCHTWTEVTTAWEHRNEWRRGA